MSKVEAGRLRAKVWHSANRGRALANQRRYRERNPEKVAASTKAWQRDNPEKRILARAKYRAKKSGAPFNIDISDIVIPILCPVLGIRMTMGLVDSAPSIDRIDNSRGYVKGNIVIVSWRANRLKNDATLAELAQILQFYLGIVGR